MLLLYSGLVVFGALIMVLLLKFYKCINGKDKKRTVCNFKFSTVKFKKRDNKTTALFDIRVADKHSFFIDFPVLFKFYSDNRFKSKVKICYKSSSRGKKEEIINKTIIFETKTEECIHYINDIIIGEIFFEIEMNTEYGKPIIEFSILENKVCKLGKEYKIEIKFPDK